MIYKALVIDNSKFFERGTITVRIANFYFGEMTWDLVDKFPEQINENKIEGNDSRTLDWEAKIFSPLGGGRNYGALFLPQINESGLVTFINGNQRDCIWMGSLFESFRDDDYKVTHLNIPSDGLSTEGVDSDAVITDTAEALKKNFILRTKNTTFIEGDPDALDWDRVNTTNVLSIGEKEFLLRHYAEEDGWNENVPEKYQDILLHRNEEGVDEIKIESTNVVDEVSSKITVAADTINISTTSVDGENSFTVSTLANNTIEIKDLYENTIYFTVDGINISAAAEKEINLNSENLNITTTSDLTLHGDNININADTDVILTGGGKVILQGDEGGAVRITELLSIVGAFEGHGHICPTGPTVGGPTDGTPAPLAPQLIGDKQSMESSVIGMK